MSKSTVTAHPPPADDTHDVLDTIRKNVLAELGIPPSLKAVQVKQVGSGYRVNVQTKSYGGDSIDVLNIQILHSFYIKTDSDGKITSSDPPIMRAYR